MRDVTLSAMAVLALITSTGLQAQPSTGRFGGEVGQRDEEVSGASPAHRGWFYPTGLDPAGDNWLVLRSEPNGRGVRLMKTPS